MTNYTAQIQSLYVAYFSRPADYYGLQYWESVVATVGSTEAVSAAFAGSAEYQAEYGGTSFATAVNTAYRNLFGRDADLPGLGFWTNGLVRGDFTIAQAVTAIAAGAQGSDLIAYDAKVTAATAFTKVLDTAQEVLWYSGRSANLVGREFLSRVIDADSLAAALHRLGLYGPYESGLDWFITDAHGVALAEGAEQINLSIDGTALLASPMINESSQAPAPESSLAQLIGVPGLSFGLIM